MQTLLSHPAEHILEGYALRGLADRHADMVEEHLLCCEGCRVALTGLDEEIAIMRLALN